MTKSLFAASVAFLLFLLLGPSPAWTDEPDSKPATASEAGKADGEDAADEENEEEDEEEERKLPSFEVPDGTPEEIMAFVEELRGFRPANRKEYITLVTKGRQALVEASEKILEQNPDKGSKAYEFAMTLKLSDQARNIGRMSAERQQEVLADAVEFVKSKKELSNGDMSLGMSIARGLEYGGAREMAVKANETFAKAFSESEQEGAERIAAIFAGAARRLDSVGKPFQLQGKTFEGDKFNVKKYRGKVVLVDFWATWCGPCRAEYPRIRELYEAYHEKGFDVVGVSTDQDRDALAEYLEQKQVPWVTLHNPDGRPEAAEYYGVSALPTMILLDKEGKVVSLEARGPELARLLTEMLGPIEEDLAAGEGADEKSSDDAAEKEE